MIVSILIPAYNEEHNIRPTIQGVRRIPAQLLPTLEWEVIVIDDGSSDNTKAQAQKCGLRTLRLDRNRGKGAALQYGLQHARGQIIMFLDADLKETASEGYKLVAPLVCDSADVTVAKFKPLEQTGGFGLVKTLAAGGVKYFSGQNFSAPLSGQRAFKRTVLDAIAPLPDDFGLELGMLIDILAQGYRVLEVDVDMCHDVTGRDWAGFVHRGSQFIQISKLLLKKLREQRTYA